MISQGSVISAGRGMSSEPVWVRRILFAVVLVFLSLFLFLPIVTVLTSGLHKGAAFFLKAISEKDALAAIRLTLLAAAVSVPLNVFFGTGNFPTKR